MKLKIKYLIIIVIVLLAIIFICLSTKNSTFIKTTEPLQPKENESTILIIDNATENVTEEATEAENNTSRSNEYYKELYSPANKTITIDGYTLDYIDGAPSSVYTDIINAKEKEQLMAKEETTIEDNQTNDNYDESYSDNDDNYDDYDETNYNDTYIETDMLEYIENDVTEEEISESIDDFDYSQLYCHNNSGDDLDGQLTAYLGVYYYGDQKETYYNLPMGQVVENAHNAGIEGEYWIRDDGCKMLGDYIMIAANQDVHPYGSIVDTSLGQGIVVDTGGFAYYNSTQVDIATDW